MTGTVIGGTAMAVGLGVAIRPVAGGAIFDGTASYDWLFIGALHRHRRLIALTFRPFAPPRTAVAV